MLLAALVVPLLEAGNGVTVGPPAVIANADSPTGVVDHKGVLAVWRQHGCIMLARLAADATPGTPTQLGCGATGAPRATVDYVVDPRGRTYLDLTLVVWPAGSELAGALVTPDLRVTPIHVKGEHPIAVSASYDGEQFLVTTASCTSAQLLTLDHAGTVKSITALATTKPHDDVAITGAVVACEGGRLCEVGYSTANAKLGIACEDQIRKPRWSAMRFASLMGGVPQTYSRTDDPTYKGDPAHDNVVTRHGMAWPLGGFNRRREVGASVIGDLIATTSYESNLWNGRETVTPDHVELEFVPRELQPVAHPAAHHVPLAMPGETAPYVVALGGEHFVLLSVARDGVVARAITIDPAYFTHPPQARGPVLTGTLHMSTGKPATSGSAGCLVRREVCDQGLVHQDSTFVLPAADPLDFRVAQQADGVPVLAYSNDEYWFTPALHESRAEVKLTAAAHITGTVAWPGGTLPKAAPMPVEREEYGPHRGDVRGPPEDPLQLTFDAHGLLPVIAPTAMASVLSMYSYGLHKDGTFDVPVVASGRAIFHAQTRNREWGRAMWVKTKPGAEARVTLALQRTSTLVIRLKGHKMALGDDMRLGLNTFGCMDDGVVGCTFEHVSPGPTLVSFTTPDWTMLRAIDVPPGAKKIVDLPFVPDLAPGDPGVHVARAIDGITVTAVAPGGPAAGLLAPDDVITAIDGAAVGTDLGAAIAKLRGAPDSRVEVTVTRARRSQKLTLTRSHGASLP